MTEDQLEQETLGWLADVGYAHAWGPDIAPDGPSPERADCGQVLLVERLRRAIETLNPSVPKPARDDALGQVLDLGTPVLLAANRQFHRLLVNGVPVQYQLEGETRGDFVRLVDWAEPTRNQWLAVNQFSISGPRHTRRPDIVLFVNGLPLVLIELKNPADPHADVWKAFHQLQTYKEQITDAFQYNELLVISDGSDALLGSLCADAERFMAWRTIDGVTLDPLGRFNELQTLVRGVLAPAYLLDYLRFFVLFEQDGQDSGVWSRRLPASTIQKFMPGEDEDAFPLLSDRRNIVVIADEAHRTQYGFEARLKTVKQRLPITPFTVTTGTGEASPYYAGEPRQSTDRYQVGYAQHLRDALPNATFVAFTGTPVSGEDRDIRAVFGDYISVYDMQQAREDGATVAIYYESRLAKLGLKADELATIDDEVDELAEDEEECQQARLKSRWAALEKVVGAAPAHCARIARVAADLVAHFEERSKAQTGEAMVVGMSRDICVHLYDEIVKLRPGWHDADPERGAIKIVMTGAASDKALLRPHLYSAKTKKRLEKRFKDPADPLRLVIVRDMWLTGFDAPCVDTLSIDKPMKGHTLMQAIARVNPVFRNKPGGLVVDYIGIANELKSALKEYTASQGRGRPTVDAHEAYSVLAEKLDALRGMLSGTKGRGFDYSRFLTGEHVAAPGRSQAATPPRGAGPAKPAPGGLHSLLAGAANFILGIKDGKKRFADLALAMSKAFTLCCTLDEAKAVREEVAFFQAVKVILTKREISEAKKTDEERELAIRQIIGSAVVSEEVVDIFDAVGLDKPNIGHPRRCVPGRGAHAARAQPGGGTAAAAARRRDQVTLRRQRGAELEVLRHAERRGAALPEPFHRSRAGDGGAGADGWQVPRGGGAWRTAGPERGRGALLRRAGQQRVGGARADRRDAEKDRARAGREPAQEPERRLVGARERSGQAAADGQAHPAQVQVPAESAGGGGGTGAAAGERAGRGLGVGRHRDCAVTAQRRHWPNGQGNHRP